MQVTIESFGVIINEDIETKIQRQLQLSLSRVESYITTIKITLTSGEKNRGSNTHCRLTLAIVNKGNIVIEDTQMDLERVINRVLQKASRAIERLVFNT